MKRVITLLLVVCMVVTVLASCATAAKDTTEQTTEATTGATTGTTAGTTEGTTAGTTEGTTAGTTEGTTAGTTEGTTAGTTEGTTAGTTEGTTAGTTEGTTAGTTEGTTAGTTEGTTAGTTEATTETTLNGTTIDTTESTTQTTVTTEATTAPTETSETNVYGEEEVAGTVFDWADIYFEDEVIRIIARDDYKVQKEWGYIDTADVDGLSVEIEKRNAKVEKDLGVSIEMTYLADQWSTTFREIIMAAVQNDHETGLNAYDVVACYGYVGMSNAYRDIWANLLDKDTFPYFEFDLACWNQGIYKNGTVNGRLYLCSGDFNISLFDSTMIMWHNKDLYENLLEKTNDTTSPKDLQDTIIAGEWYYSEIYKWASYYENKDIESNKGDIFGLYLQGEIYPTQPFDAIPYAWDLEFINTNPDGTHEYNYRDNQRAEDAMNMFRNLWGNEGTATETTHGPSFPSGNLLFKGDVIWFSEEGNLALRNMRDRYSLTPWPKFDETQDHYATTSQDYFTTMAVIDHSESPIPTKGDVISAYLQYATEYSYTNVRMFYFKEIVEPKYFGNFTDGTTKKSIAIFNTIIDNLEYDYGTIYGPALENVIKKCWTENVLLHYAGGTKDLGTTTVFQKYWDNHVVLDKALEDLDRWFGLID